MSDADYLNWDTNWGYDKFTNDAYAASRGLSADLIARGIYLADLRAEDVEGYFAFVRGLTLEHSKRMPEAIAEYRVAVRKYPRSPSARNNIAWQFASSRAAQAQISKEEALRLATEACDLFRSDCYLDTLACIYAELGDFESALRAEQEAFSLCPLPQYQAMLKAFSDKTTYLDLQQSSSEVFTSPEAQLL